MYKYNTWMWQCKHMLNMWWCASDGHLSMVHTHFNFASHNFVLWKMRTPLRTVTGYSQLLGWRWLHADTIKDSYWIFTIDGVAGTSRRSVKRQVHDAPGATFDPRESRIFTLMDDRVEDHMEGDHGWKAVGSETMDRRGSWMGDHG